MQTLSLRARLGLGPWSVFHQGLSQHLAAEHGGRAQVLALAGETVGTCAEDEEFSYAVWVQPTDELKARLREELKTDDAWSYLDQLTGGCCNAFNEDEGTYEVTVFGASELAEMRNNKLLIVKDVKHNECYVGQ